MSPDGGIFRALRYKRPAELGTDVEGVPPRPVVIPGDRRIFSLLSLLLLMMMTAVLILGNWREHGTGLGLGLAFLALTLVGLVRADIRNNPLTLDETGFHVPGFASMLWRDCGTFRVSGIPRFGRATVFDDLGLAGKPGLLRRKVFSYPTGMTRQDTCRVLNHYRNQAYQRRSAQEPPS